MNAFQRKALAKSLGMEASEMGDMLVKQEQLNSLSQVQGAGEIKDMDTLVKKYQTRFNYKTRFNRRRR